MGEKVYNQQIKINDSLNDIDKIKLHYKQLGINALVNKNYTSAINYFNMWQYAYITHCNIDKYDYDFSLLKFIEAQLSDFCTPLSYEPIKNNGKVRIIYLLHGVLNSTSILPKILLEIVKYHDTSRFEIHIFVTENWIQIMRSSGRVFIKQFGKTKCKIYYAPLFQHGFSKILSIVKKMCNIKPHILITTAALADFEHFFISALNPAPIRVGFIFANPAQFIPPSFDFGISWINHIIQDCPVPCINPGLTYIPNDKIYEKLLKTNCGLPDNAIIIISAGRYPKFQNGEFLKLIFESMRELPNLHYIIVGVVESQFPLLNTIPEDLKSRVYMFEWSDMYEKYLAISDIYLDTYPSGGGVTLLDAALLHLPIISFTDDLLIPFDQCNWNPAQEIFPKNSIILVDRNNISGLKSAIYTLYHNSDLRKTMGNEIYKSITNLRSNVQENVKKIENLYDNLVKEKL
jgi:predicted O-linked N-acetylglucosamine transferase (SPINDLY family)